MNEQRVYSDEFKAQAVEMAMQPGATKAGVARSLGINPNTLAGWIINFKKAKGIIDPPKIEDERSELIRHQRSARNTAGQRRASRQYDGLVQDKQRIQRCCFGLRTMSLDAPSFLHSANEQSERLPLPSVQDWTNTKWDGMHVDELQQHLIHSTQTAGTLPKEMGLWCGHHSPMVV